jgi:DNA invertase Pin-like site-specific DNA recombinase
VIVAYLRVSTDRQELGNQRFEIERFCQQRGYVVDEWRDDTKSGTSAVKDRKLGALLDSLKDGDTLIVSEVSRISRSINTVLNTLQDCLARGITIISVKENMVFGDDLNSKIIAVAFGLAAEIERSLISARTKEALARKRAEGVTLGRPKGSTKPEHYKLHGKDKRILRLMEKRVSVSAIARILDVNRKTLQTYIDRQNLRQQLRWRLVEKMDDKSIRAIAG